MAEFIKAWCPDCKRWVPYKQMHYFDGLRVCTWCMEGTQAPVEYVLDAHHEQVQCLYCDSWDTYELVPNYLMFKCKNCGETFHFNLGGYI